ncbi:uncharacterized protein LOC129225105 [Uloborus diversus]|uniref:uncharacterized protein LOC129225105 n=1 Tax=Uloborus diversus TaxID=327109 RepID=UPI00240965EC|nr:uncharacterized protein LOC129225105 [Uloborus diversus]
MIRKIIVLFYGIGFVVASPKCSDEEASKCIPEDGEDLFKLENTWPGTEERLAEICPVISTQLDCAIAFAERCPHTRIGLYLEGLKRHKSLYNKLCDKSNDFRAKYLKLISCVNEKISTISNECEEHLDMLAANFQCTKSVQDYKKCVNDIIKDDCGVEHADVFSVIYEARVPIYEVACEEIYETLKDLGVIS